MDTWHRRRVSSLRPPSRSATAFLPSAISWCGPSKRSCAADLSWTWLEVRIGKSQVFCMLACGYSNQLPLVCWVLLSDCKQVMCLFLMSICSRRQHENPALLPSAFDCTGKGDLSWLLVNADAADAVVVDPRVTDHTKISRTAMWHFESHDGLAKFVCKQCFYSSC